MTEKQLYYIFSSRRRHTRSPRDWSSDVCSSDLGPQLRAPTTWTPSTARSSRLSAEDPAVSAAPHRPQEAAMTQPDDYEVDPTQEPARTPHPDPAVEPEQDPALGPAREGAADPAQDAAQA